MLSICGDESVQMREREVNEGALASLHELDDWSAASA